MTLFIEDSGIIQEAESNQLSLGKQLLYNYSLTTPNAMNISDIQSESVTSIMDSLKKNSSSQPLDQLLTETEATDSLPTVTANVTDDGFSISWDKVSVTEGFRYYKIVASRSDTTPSYPENGYAKVISNPNITSADLIAGSVYRGGDIGGSLNAGETYYFSVSYVFDNTVLTGTPVTVTVPESSSALPSDTLVSSPSVSPSPSEKPTVNPSVKPSAKPSAKSTDVQAAVFSSPSLNTGIDGNSLIFAWTPVNSGTVKYNGFTYTGFKYYKIVASATDSTPVYPENGYLTYIADCNASSCAITPSSGNYHQSPVLQPGTSYYFSVTYVFENGKFTSNTTTQTVPASGTPQAPVPSTEPSTEPAPAPAPAPLPAVSSLNLSVSSDGSSLFFNWTPLGTSSITYGGTEYSSFRYYKVVASETNPNPVYPADGYLTYLTDPNSSGWSVCPAGGGYNQSPTLISGKTYYFSITYVFDNGKISSNTVQYLVP